MKISFCSDTHGMHGQLTQQIIAAKPEVLVHCGDFTTVGKRSEVGDFADWCTMLLRKNYVKHVVAIAGNHDLLFDATHKASREDPTGRDACRERLRDAGVKYLEDAGCRIGGVSFFGIPWTQQFYDWAFQIPDLSADQACFDIVPPGVDVLVTHGPPNNVRDLVPRGEHVGSPALHRLLWRQDRTPPRIIAFGHIHEGYGISLVAQTLCVNASTCTGAYKPTNPLVTVDLAPFS